MLTYLKSLQSCIKFLYLQFSINQFIFQVSFLNLLFPTILTKTVGAPVSWRLGGQLATMLVATNSQIIPPPFSSILVSPSGHFGFCGLCGVAGSEQVLFSICFVNSLNSPFSELLIFSYFYFCILHILYFNLSITCLWLIHDLFITCS